MDGGVGTPSSFLSTHRHVPGSILPCPAVPSAKSAQDLLHASNSLQPVANQQKVCWDRTSLSRKQLSHPATPAFISAAATSIASGRSSHPLTLASLRTCRTGQGEATTQPFSCSPSCEMQRVQLTFPRSAPSSKCVSHHVITVH